MRAKKNIYYSLVLVSFVVFGCKSPVSKQSEAEKKQAKVEAKIDKQDEKAAEASKGYVYGADYALSQDPTPSEFSQVAKGLTGRSLLMTGQPDLATALFYQKLVTDLISTNAAIKKEAQERLAAKDKEHALDQAEKKSLTEQLVKVQDENKALARQNAQDAMWKYRIKQALRWALWIIGIGIVVHVVSLVAPPPYNNIFAIPAFLIGGLIRMVFSFFPNAFNVAGVVKKDIHSVSETALSHLVEAIQEVKKLKPDTFAEIEPILKDKTDKQVSRPKIDEIKRKIS